MKKTLILVAGSLFLLSGCAKHFNHVFKENMHGDVKLSKNIDFHNYVKEKKNKDFFIDFSVNRDLKSAIATLNRHDKNNVYILENTQEDIIFPDLTTNDSKKLHIDSYYKLKNFIAKTTNYIIKVKNPFVKGIKKIIVMDKERVKNNIFNYPFQINGKISVENLLRQISKITHYSVIFENNSITKNISNISNNSNNMPSPPPPPNINNVSSPSSANGNNILMRQSTLKLNYTPPSGAKEVDFSGHTIGELLTYLSNQFNYFVDVDFKNKLIIFKRYKTFTFNMIFPDATINNKLAKTKATPYITNIITSIKSFIKDGQIDYKNGIVIAKITKQDYPVLSSLIKKINSEFLKQAKINVDIYVFALKKNINFGADISLITSKIKAITSYNANPVLTANKFSANSDNSVLSFITKYSFYNRIINKVPITLNFDKDQDYIKSIQQTTTTSTASTTTTSTQIGTIVDGQTFTIIPNIYSNKVFLKTLFTNQNNEALIEKNFGNNVIMLPTNTKETLPNAAILKYGERKIVGVYQIYKRVDENKGLIPSDVNIISRVIGNTKIQYIREVIAIVVSVKK